MTTIDRAFIKAFGQEKEGPAALPERASLANPPSDQGGSEVVGVPGDAPDDKPGEPTAPACSCSARGTCSCPPEETEITDRVTRLAPGPTPEAPIESTSQRVSEMEEAADSLAVVPLNSEPASPAGASCSASAVVPNAAGFQPAFQVDSFAWPSGCTRLSMVAGEQLEHLADALTSGLEQGRQVVAMSGCRRGDGCTTLLLSVARHLAERGLRVAMLDADFDNPLLARRLGLLAEAGWEEVLANRLPIEEVVIESVQDRLAVLPLCGSLPCRGCPAKDLPDPASRLDVLREHYDLVLVDLGQFGDGTSGADGSLRAVVEWIDAVVLVHNVRATSQEQLNQVRRRVEAAGLVEAGITENFVDVRRSA